jgi:hypothetical protein
VPVGNVALIDATKRDGLNDQSEQRVVKGHGSLIVDPLARPHDTGALVVDAGEPVDPYEPAGPPDDPEVPGSEITVPKSPVVDSVTPKALKHQAVVRFTPKGNGGSPILKFEAKCVPVRRGEVRSLIGEDSPLKVKYLTKDKKYRCKVRAKNKIGFGNWSDESSTFTAK